MATPLPSIDALQNISNMSKSALDAGLVKADARVKATLWAQVAALDDYLQEQRKVVAPHADPAPAATEPPSA